MQPSDPESDAAELVTIHEFLLALSADMESGGPRPVDDYLKAFPGHEELLRREYAEALESAPSSESPQTLGHYRLDEMIGRGGQATVYRARDTRLSRDVALKVFRAAELFENAAAIARFRREADLLSRLDHPGICTVFGAGSENGAAWIAMRLVKGETLAQSIDSERERLGADLPEASEPLDVRREWITHVIAVIESVARAVETAHAAGIVHRDLKPGNVMIDATGAPVVLDFGLAAVEDQGHGGLTQSGDVLGTPAFMAPEQIRGDRARIDRRVDVYALGVILYECVTLRRPFTAPTREGLYRAILDEDPSPPRRLARGIPSDLAVVVETAMAKEPTRRYQTAADLAEDLRRLRMHEPIRARPATALTRLSRWARRRPAVAALALLLMVGVPTVTGLVVYVLVRLPDIRAQDAARLARAVERELELGFGDLAEGDPRKAVDAFSRALALRQDSAEAVAGAALSRLRLNDPADALRILDLHGEVSARTPGLLRLRADVLRALGREAEATALVSGLAQPDDALGWFLAGSRLALTGHRTNDAKVWLEAQRAFDQAVRLAPVARALYHFEAAHVAGHAHDEAAARAAAQAIQRLWPDHEDTYWWSGLALMDVDPPAGAAAFRKLLTLRPNDAQAFSLLGRITANQGRLDEAETLFRKAVALRPDKGDLRHELGYLLLLQKRPDDAVDAYRQATELDPKSPLFWTDYAAILTQVGRNDDALAASERGVAALPDSAALRFTHATALETVGRRADAKAAYEACLARDPSVAEAHCNLGLLLRAEGALDQALVHLKRGHELGSKRPGWTYPSADWVSETERMIKDQE